MEGSWKGTIFRLMNCGFEKFFGYCVFARRFVLQSNGSKIYFNSTFRSAHSRVRLG